MARLLPLLLLLFLTVLLSRLPSPCASLPIRLNLTHINSKFSNISIEDRNLLAIKRGKLRLAFISSRLSTSLVDVQTNVQYSNQEYSADLAIGTPPVSVSVLLDTGSDLIWTKCEQGSAYNPSASSTYSPLSCGSTFCQNELTSCSDGSTCSFYSPYGSATVGGTMGAETFSFGGTNVPSLAFGCSNSEMGSATTISGLLGMGGGQLSLVSQLGSEKFSYCLTPYDSQSTSPLFLGSLANPDSSSQTTPLGQSPNIPTYYYLSLQGITVGSTKLSIPSSAFAISSDGSGGLIIDSGTSFTMLVPSAYDVLKQEFQSQMGLPVASGNTFDLCFSSPSDGSFQPPKLIFNFQGADMDLPKENYLVSDAGGSLLCLAILPSDQSLSLFGNFQQQNMHIVYDVQGGNLYFAPAQCANL
ncbi:aspartic proteinase nepenthesin-1-like [Phalaenopsis equestris]|uniref:aspartic proteinase nepenthesin-1-like n=1 Tax=Phalaenopsis equestris TaxID=78828 RepID=UPI0009E27FD3|nr:aspartic proteinase nepenthesin-1-like [Phalaenopsis equestris]